jgi:hypothetical protein
MHDNPGASLRPPPVIEFVPVGDGFVPSRGKCRGTEMPRSICNTVRRVRFSDYLRIAAEAGARPLRTFTFVPTPGEFVTPPNRLFT